MDGRWDILLKDRRRNDRKILKGSVCDLTLHRDTHLQEVQKAFVSITRIGGASSAFNISYSLVDQVNQLAREVAKKDKYLDSALASLSSTKVSLSTTQEDLENLHLEHVSLVQI